MGDLQAVALIMRTADNEAREARTYPDGSYSCPFCGAAVMSPAGWGEMQRLNAEHYARSGEAYTIELYPRSMRLVFEMQGCPNPACITLLNPVDLASRRAYLAEREAEDAQRKRMHESAMQRIAESREADAALWQELAARAESAGQCLRCLRASYWRSEHSRRMVRHRDAANCPQARKYAGV
jgi:hypothetical protein